MLPLLIEEAEYYDEDRDEIITIPATTLKLEHSLISVSEWEAKYKRPFLSEKQGPSTPEETYDYIRFMTINKNVDPAVYKGITEDHVQKIVEYIQDPMTATTFKKTRRGRTQSFITSEIIYWQMVTLGIPFECEKWNLNRLLTLIRVCDEKGQPPKKMSQNDLLRQYAGVNARRRPKKH